MADDGGSTGILRDELGVLPPGDVRQCLVALSESPQILRDLFNYRFPKKTSLAGHSFGNLFLSAMEMMSHDFAEAVRQASELLHIKGRVVPITLTKTTLHLATGDGEVVGEYAIAHTPLLPGEQPRFWLHPHSVLNPDAKAAIAEADAIVIAPGHLYGSLIPALLVDGVKEALQATPARTIYVCNLVNKNLQTKDFSISDYAHTIEHVIGEGTIDVVLYNTDVPDRELLKQYALDDEYPVQVHANDLKHQTYRAVGRPLLSRQHRARNKNDKFIKRSLIRHEGDAVAQAIMELMHEA